jgi:hypothetical protein
MAKVTDLDVMQRSRRLLTGAVMLLVGGLIGWALPHHSASAQSEQGTVSAVTAGHGGAATMFTFTPVGGQPIRVWAPPVWQVTQSGPWRTTGTAPCLIKGKTVTLGLVDVSTINSAPGNWIVSSITCDSR